MTLSERDKQIAKEYVGGDYPKSLGIKYNISERQVQRIVRAAGVIRTQSESYILAIKQGRKTYSRLPPHLKKKRKHITDKMRYFIFQRDKFRCVLCGATAKECLRLEVDHIDENPTHNEELNLRILCNRCNCGKSFVLSDKTLS